MRQLDEEAQSEAKRRARNLVADALQRVAASHAAETTSSLIELPSDDMKGRIIGREGRNIRTLEHLTGVDVIVDDTPQAVVLSSFDPIRREIAKITLLKLVEDGRIQPARIEEMYYQSKTEIDEHIQQAGEQAVFEANCGDFHEEIVKLLGRLNYRTSYGQNVLKHTLEVVHLAGLMATELEANVKTAKRAAMLHDVGKALTHEVEGSHAAISTQYAKRYGETPGVIHAVEAHHYEVQPQTVEAVLLIAADAISGARPGARGDSLENYIKRLAALEELAAKKPGVEKVYALQAGREIRVIVKPGEINDDEAALLSHEIAREIENDLEYPGQIKVTVIREFRRNVEFAKYAAASAFARCGGATTSRRSVPDERSRLGADQGHARGARAGGGALAGGGGRDRLQHLHDPREAGSALRRAPRQREDAEGRRPRQGDRRRRLLRGGAARAALRALPVRRRRLRPGHDPAPRATGSAPAARRPAAASAPARSASSPARCRCTANAASRPGCRSRWAATRSARTASCPPCAGARQSRRPGEILAEVTRLAAEGVREITLLGQNVNSWGRDLAPDVRTEFGELLRACDAVDGIERIRFTSPHPKDFRREVIAAMADCDAGLRARAPAAPVRARPGS